MHNYIVRELLIDLLNDINISATEKNKLIDKFIQDLLKEVMLFINKYDPDFIDKLGAHADPLRFLLDSISSSEIKDLHEGELKALINRKINSFRKGLLSYATVSA